LSLMGNGFVMGYLLAEDQVAKIFLVLYEQVY